MLTEAEEKREKARKEAEAKATARFGSDAGVELDKDLEPFIWKKVKHTRTRKLRVLGRNIEEEEETYYKKRLGVYYLKLTTVAEALHDDSSDEGPPLFHTEYRGKDGRVFVWKAGKKKRRREYVDDEDSSSAATKKKPACLEDIMTYKN